MFPLSLLPTCSRSYSFGIIQPGNQDFQRIDNVLFSLYWYLWPLLQYWLPVFEKIIQVSLICNWNCVIFIKILTFIILCSVFYILLLSNMFVFHTVKWKLACVLIPVVHGHGMVPGISQSIKLIYCDNSR